MWDAVVRWWLEEPCARVQMAQRRTQLRAALRMRRKSEMRVEH